MVDSSPFPSTLQGLLTQTDSDRERRPHPNGIEDSICKDKYEQDGIGISAYMHSNTPFLPLTKPKINPPNKGNCGFDLLYNKCKGDSNKHENTYS